jgi:hypothetical protein
MRLNLTTIFINGRIDARRGELAGTHRTVREN